MRYALISDIHGNLEALEAVLKDVDNRKADKIFCLGDIVGYGANPRECIHVLEDRGISGVMGNHDLAIVNPGKVLDLNPVAKESIDWTREELGFDEREILRKMPFVIEENKMVLAHADIVKPEDFDYIFDPARDLGAYAMFNRAFIDENFKLLKEGQVLFIGHTHEPLKLTKDEKIICNVGSVGQPRDEDRRACYVIYDEKKIEHVRVEYDINKTAEKIRRAGLPDELAMRLFLGL